MSKPRVASMYTPTIVSITCSNSTRGLVHTIDLISSMNLAKLPGRESNLAPPPLQLFCKSQQKLPSKFYRFLVLLLWTMLWPASPRFLLNKPKNCRMKQGWITLKIWFVTLRFHSCDRSFLHYPSDWGKSPKRSRYCFNKASISSTRCSACSARCFSCSRSWQIST